MSGHYYNPVRAWCQRRAYRPVEWVWFHVPMTSRMYDRIGAWLYTASGAGRRSTRREAERARRLAKNLPLIPRSRFERPTGFIADALYPEGRVYRCPSCLIETGCRHFAGCEHPDAPGMVRGEA